MATGDLADDLRGKDRRTILKALNDSGNSEAKRIATDATRSITSSSSSSDGNSIGDSLVNAVGKGFKVMTDDTNRLLGLQLGEVVKKMASGEGVLGTFKAILSATVDGIGDIVGSLASIDAEARKQVVTTGGYYGDLAKGMMGQMLDIMGDTAALGVTSQQVLDGVGNLADASNRMALFSQDTISGALTAGAAFGKTNAQLLDSAEKFRNVGLGLADAGKNITEIGQRSVSLGLNARKVTGEVIAQLDKLNSYGFKDGIEGLGRMVQEAQSLNINMEKTFAMASDLFDPSKAIDLSANLAALGGAFGDFADPIKLMYDATNNVEGLQKSLIGAARGLATYNEQQGKFEVTGANLRRANEMAKALNMSTSELTSTAIKAASKMEAMSKLDMFPSLTKDQKEFVSNLATMKDGKVGFDLPEDVAEKLGMNKGFNTIEQMGGNIANFQKIQEEIAKKKPEELAREQYNAITNIAGLVGGIAYRMGATAMKSDTVTKTANIASGVSSELYKDFNPKGKTSGEIKDLAFQKAAAEIKEGSREMGEGLLRAMGMSDTTISELEKKIQSWKKESGDFADKVKNYYQNTIAPKAHEVFDRAKAKMMGNGSNTKQPDNINGQINVKHEFPNSLFRDSTVGTALMHNKVLNDHIKTTVIDTLTERAKKGQYDNSHMG